MNNNDPYSIKNKVSLVNIIGFTYIGFTKMFKEKFNFCNYFRYEKNISLFFSRISRGFAVESILSAAFGLEGKSQSETNKRITAYGQLFFGGHGKLWAVLQWLPYSGHYMKYWPDDFLNSMKQMYKDVKVLVENRKQSSTKKHVSNENSLSVCRAKLFYALNFFEVFIFERNKFYLILI